jgi:tetratricopeptide (TPR) repeat protein
MKGFLFRKSYQVLPGVRINVSKSGLSLSLGPKGARVTTGPRGTHLHLDLPGAGIYYRKRLDAPEEQKDGNHQATQDEAPKVGLLNRLTTPADELELVDALRALHEGQEDQAYQHARNAVHLADGAFLAGFLAFKREQYAEAAAYFSRALERKDGLGKAFEKYEVDMGVELPITEDVGAHIQPNENGVLLALAEAYQRDGKAELAIETLLRLHQNDPDDLIVRLSLAELFDQRYPNGEQAQRQIVQLAENVHNESPIHAALMLYRARALRKLGLLEGAQDTITKALRRKKGYPNDLLLALRYERALIYEALGKVKEARKEFQKVYAEAPSYEDVAAKLGL